MSKLLHDDNDDTKAIAIPQIFPENSQAKKDKLLLMSNFSFSHSVFKRHKGQTHKNKGLFGKRLSQL